MKKVFQTIIDDIRAEGFSRKEILWYGIVWPLGLVLALGLIEGLSH